LFSFSIEYFHRKPVEEVQKSGALGIFKGVGLGLVGVAMKPVIGVTDGISSVASGVTQQIAKATSDSLLVSNARPQRAFERSVIDDADLVLVPVDVFAAEAQQLILRLAKSRSYSDSFVACVSLGFSRETVEPVRPYAVCLSDMYIFLLNRDSNCLLQIPFGDISHFEQISDIRIDLIVYRNRSMSSSRFSSSTSATSNANCLSESIYCATKSHSLRLYSTLSRYAQRMGNPSAIQSKASSHDVPSVSDANSVISASSRITHDSRTASEGHIPSSPNSKLSANNTDSGRFLPTLSISKVSTESYQFGTANSIQFPNVSLSNSDIIQRARESFLQQRPLHDINDTQGRNTYQRDLDWKVWLLISNWRSNHFIFHPSRCLACLIINYSPNQVQIVDVKLKEGENIAILGVNLSFEPDSRTLLSHGGAAVVFFYGYAPSLTDLAHVKVLLELHSF